MDTWLIPPKLNDHDVMVLQKVLLGYSEEMSDREKMMLALLLNLYSRAQTESPTLGSPSPAGGDQPQKKPESI